MSQLFQQIHFRFFGETASKENQSTSSNARNLLLHVRRKKQVWFNEEKNKVYVITNMEDKKPKKIRRRLISVSTKPYVPPVGTILTDKSHSGFFSAVVIMPDHRLLEIQRGGHVGLELEPRTIFHTPYDWQCWLRSV